MKRGPHWRTLLDPRDPDYDGEPADAEHEADPTDLPDADDPAEYEGTARYHGGAL